MRLTVEAVEKPFGRKICAKISHFALDSRRGEAFSTGSLAGFAQI
jgi:hypothetical protein